MKRFAFFFFTINILAFSITSCEKEDPDIIDEPELITTLNYTLTPMAGGDSITFSFQDLDGDGGNVPVITNGTLSTNTTYTGELVLLNESDTPAENISDEVRAEDEAHQFFFQNTVNGLDISYADQDMNGNPVGLSSSLTTSKAGQGTITIILRHEPNKTAEGVSTGDITNAGGETDIQVTFDVNVQ